MLHPSILSAHAAQPETSAQKTPAQAAGEIVFPPPPDQPRIRYLYSLAGPQDIKPRVGWFKGFLLRLVGKGRRSGRALVRPYGVYAAAGRVFVADTGGMAVAVFDRTAGRLARFGGTRAGRLINPIGVAGDEAGNVYVTDSGMNVVNVYGPDGALLRQFGAAAGLKNPTGAAYDAVRKRLIVADTRNARLVLFDVNGGVQGTIGRRGTEKGTFPSDRSGAGPGRQHYVVEGITGRVGSMLRTGSSSRNSARGNLPGYLNVPRIALDSDGNIYVVDSAFNAVQIFDEQAAPALRGSTAPGTFELPTGIFIDRRPSLCGGLF